MSWDWKKTAKSLGAMGLEFIGGAVLGPAGGQVGGKLASVLGLKDDASPEEVEQALQSATPDQMIRLREIDAQLKKAQMAHAEEMSRIVSDETTGVIRTVNTTMQAEAAIGHPWSGAWRPFWGFVSAIAFFVAVIGIFVMAGWAIKQGDEKLLAQIPTMILYLGGLFSIPGAILGVASWHRGQKQRIEAGETKATVLGTVNNFLNNRS